VPIKSMDSYSSGDMPKLYAQFQKKLVVYTSLMRTGKKPPTHEQQVGFFSRAVKSMVATGSIMCMNIIMRGPSPEDFKQLGAAVACSGWGWDT